MYMFMFTFTLMYVCVKSFNRWRIMNGTSGGNLKLSMAALCVNHDEMVLKDWINQK